MQILCHFEILEFWLNIRLLRCLCRITERKRGRSKTSGGDNDDMEEARKRVQQLRQRRKEKKSKKTSYPKPVLRK